MSEVSLLSKQEIIDKLQAISGNWYPNARHGNDGGVGNTLEDILGIAENNLPIPNAAEWELKSQRANGTSLLTMFHMEPSPRAAKIVPKILLPSLGWDHKGAGTTYSAAEKSFRMTISAARYTDRGFSLRLNSDEQKLEVIFDPNMVSDTHKEWLRGVSLPIPVVPYWGYRDLEHKAGSKILNCFYVVAETRKEDGHEYYKYSSAIMLKDFSFSRFLARIESGDIFVDFDARTGHNHGTKFRVYAGSFPQLFDVQIQIVP